MHRWKPVFATSRKTFCDSTFISPNDKKRRPVNVFSLLVTDKSHMELRLVNRGMWKYVSESFGEELFYQLVSMCWYVVMQKIPVFTELSELRTFAMNGFPRTMSSRSV
ncbi:hypothetical protein TNCV_3102761 [Trichonephila clavipes]|nr:hypothetical protein TNCV_3102761 [Trichonephila clavipes]